jgi:putative spermidine/putrescine transport system ATP-binding protein
MPAPIISLRNIQKQFGSLVALHDINLDIEAGEFFSLLGPSGCGKTTLLRILAGIEQPTSGSLLIDGQPMAGVPANRRPTNMVFQSYAIFPHLNVEENIGYGLRNMSVSKADAAARVAEALALVKLDGLGARNAHQLSGGQRQRVALARALVCRPKVLLLDEPLSALDKNLRQDMQMELRALQRTVGITFVFVTHDQEEALTMSDRIAVMYQGRTEQVGTPFDIYNRPTTDFVASFVGTLNRISATVADPAAGKVTVAGHLVTLPHPLRTPAGQKIALALRPESIRLGRSAECDVVLQGDVTEVHFLGSVLRARIDLGGEPLSFDLFNRPGTPTPIVGTTAEISVPSADIIVLE